MAEKKKAVVGVKGSKSPQDPAAEGASIKDVTIVQKAHYYQLIQPPALKNQGTLFPITDDAVGRASNLWILMATAKKELTENMKDVEQKLINALRDTKRKNISLQVGQTVVTLFIKHVNAKEVIAIEK